MLRDLLELYGEAAKETAKRLSAVLILTAAVIMYFIFDAMLTFVVGRLVTNRTMMLAVGYGFWLVRILYVAHFAGLLTKALEWKRLRWHDLGTVPGDLFAGMTRVMFLIFLAQFVLDRFHVGAATHNLFLLETLVLARLVDPIFETVYISRQTDLEAFQSLFDFWRKNFLQWLPIALVADLALLLLPGASLFNLDLFSPVSWAVNIAVAAAFSLYMLFRGYLFSVLSTSSLRSRRFRRKANR